MLVNTEGRLYVLVHSYRAKALVIAEPIPELDNVYWMAPLKAGLQIFNYGHWPREYAALHPWLHRVLGNTCQGRTHTVKQRNGVYTQFGGLVRLGYEGDLQRDPNTGAPIILGCFDTPCMDVDAVEVEDGQIVGLVELKGRGERTTQFQRGVLKNARAAGLPYHVVRKQHRAAVSRRPEHEQ
jgi:hypothetical protein